MFLTGAPHRSSNASSNADVLHQTDGDYAEHIVAGQPKDRTASNGFDTVRACLLIRGFDQTLTPRPAVMQHTSAARSSAVSGFVRLRLVADLPRRPRTKIVNPVGPMTGGGDNNQKHAGEHDFADVTCKTDMSWRGQVEIGWIAMSAVW